MMTLTHGGDWAGFQAAYGREPLDFSSNISPLGVPAGVQQAIQQALPRLDRYPDPLCRRLCAAIADKEGCTPEQVLCGSGAVDLIHRVVQARRPRTALVTAPSFSEYEKALLLSGCRVDRHWLEEDRDFTVDASLLSSIREDTDLVFLCQPNNPTGRTIPPSLLVQILDRCAAVGAVPVVDECFLDFLDRPEEHTMTGYLEAYPNLLILKAFTKLYALAGVRLGYALCADPHLLGQLWQAGPCWSVSVPAQAAGLAALREEDYVRSVRALVAEQRTYMYQGLERLGLRVIPGEANFLLFRSPVSLEVPLARRGILLRCCGNYEGLSSTWYRTAIRTRTENQQLLAALEEILK